MTVGWPHELRPATTDCSALTEGTRTGRAVTAAVTARTVVVVVAVVVVFIVVVVVDVVVVVVVVVVVGLFVGTLLGKNVTRSTFGLGGRGGRVGRCLVEEPQPQSGSRSVEIMLSWSSESAGLGGGK